MGPSGPDPNMVLQFWQECLVWGMWFFLGMAVTAVVAYCVCLIHQWLFPRKAKRAIKTLESGGEYEEPEIP